MSDSLPTLQSSTASLHSNALLMSSEFRALTAGLHMGQPRFPWNGNDSASCFPLEINNKTLKTPPGHT
jgi:hypothetical protein